jgi:hypothetical protein
MTIFTYLLHDPLFLLQYGVRFFQKKFKIETSFFSDEKLIKELSSGKSFIRIGDGEIGLLHGKGIWYQKYDKDLERYLRKIITSYSHQSAYILGVPQFVGFTNEELHKTKGGLRCWLPSKIEFSRIFPRDSFYADAHFFYRKGNFENFLESYVSTKKILVITTTKNIKEYGAELKKHLPILTFFESAEPHPFTSFEKNYNEVIAYIKENNLLAKDVVLLISAGPSSKPLCYVFSEKGLQSLDVGHSLEHLYNENNYESHI